MNNIINVINNRQAIKNNYIQIPESGKVWVSQIEGSYPFEYALYEVTEQLRNGDFDTITNVFVDGEKGQSGPNVKPSRKGINRLTKILKGTNYRIVQVDGQRFTIEGDN